MLASEGLPARRQGSGQGGDSVVEPESDPGFTFVDRRHRVERTEAPPTPVRPDPSVPPSPEPPSPPGAGPRPDFAALCVMLYGEALMHLGHGPSLEAGQPRPDLEQARFTIDMLAMLKEKSAGNRTAEETALLDDILSTLRMGFVHQSRAG